MRTMATLDPDVERLVRDVLRERGLSFKQALNEALRRGLAPQGRPRRFVQRSFRMGEGREVRWDRALALAEAMKDEELSRKLARRK